jgi:hypothetical protein
MPDLLNFYLEKEDPNKNCLLALRDLILSQDENVTETKKYGMPCFLYKQKMFCYLWEDKDSLEPYVLMVEGKHLDYPELEKGKRSRMKILRVNPNKDIPLDTINLILKNALDLYRNGIINVK